MSTLQFSRQSLERLVGKKLTHEVLEQTLTQLGISLEGIEGDLVTVETLANRPDYLSEAGVGRAMAALLGTRTGLHHYDAKKAQYRVVVNKNLSKVRPKTACAVVRGVVFDDVKIRELIQMQEKLHQTYCRNRRKAAIGIYPLERIVWPVRFEARAPSDIKFTPLEASREMTATQILSTLPAGQAYGHLLQNLDKYPLFIDANDNVLSMPPIINSEMTGRVTESTRDVFIECSGFDQDVLDKLLNIIVCSLADQGGQVVCVEVDYAGSKHVTPDLRPESMPFSIDNVNRRLGLSLKESDVRRALAKAGLGCGPRKALIPPYRTDIMHEVDVAEEVMIGIGMDNITPLPSPVSTTGMENPRQQFKGRIAALLTGLGMLEVSTYHLDSLDNQTTHVNQKKPPIALLNKTNREYGVLRQAMLPSLLHVLRSNKHRDYPQKLFCVGTVFHKDAAAETGIRETMTLGVALSHMRADYTEARQVVEYVMRLLGLDFTVGESDEPWAIEGRVASVTAGKKRIATLGEVHPEVMQQWSLETPVAVIELDLDALFDVVNAEK
jgi:phenylalanyl-tRNA synthetase beta chain